MRRITAVCVCVMDLTGSGVRRVVQARVPENRLGAVDPLSRPDRQPGQSPRHRTSAVSKPPREISYHTERCLESLTLCTALHCP